jgi:DNA-binding transcriptional LysR family regulator
MDRPQPRELEARDLETRELAYFLAVADELHFGRAATRLGIAQPSLSKAIRNLERRLGTRLLERSSRAVALTPAGEVLASEARHALDAVSAAGRRTRRAGARQRCLILAMKAGGDAGLLPGVLAAYNREPAALPVEVIFEPDRAQLLRDGRADVAFLYRHDDSRGLDTEPLLTEAPMAVLPAAHPLADRDGLRMAELRGEPLHRPGGGMHQIGADGQIEPHPPHQPAGSANGGHGQATGGISELMQLIALGQGIAVLPESLVTPLRPDLVAIPVLDTPPSTLLLAWPAHSTSLATAAFVRAASQAAGHRPTAAGYRPTVSGSLPVAPSL